jgi:hypothetical protein
MSSHKPLLTPSQAIRILNLDHDDCDRQTARERLRYLCRTRRIAFVQIGRLIRFRPDDLEAAVNGGLVPAIIR